MPLTRTGVITPDGRTTLAGLYALGAYPQGLRPTLGVTASVQMPPGSPTRTHDLTHVTGPIPDLLHDVMQWISRNTPTGMGYGQAGSCLDVPALPPRAICELIANALVHHDLDGVTETKRVEVRIREIRDAAAAADLPTQARGLAAVLARSTILSQTALRLPGPDCKPQSEFHTLVSTDTVITVHMAPTAPQALTTWT